MTVVGEPVSRIVPAALQANKLFALICLDLSAVSIPSAWAVFWARFGHVFSEFDFAGWVSSTILREKPSG
jgi:hypothetical protein